LKLVGSLFLIISAYILGAVVRAQKIKQERILQKLSEWLCELRDSIQYKTSSLQKVVETTADSARYEDLDFLRKSVELMKQNESIKNSVINAFCESDCCDVLVADTAREMKELLVLLGSEIDSVVLRYIDQFVQKLGQEYRQLHEKNNSQRGYYEALFTLGGAAIAVMLM